MITHTQWKRLNKILAHGPWGSPAELIFVALTKKSNLQTVPPQNFDELTNDEYDIVMSYGIETLDKMKKPNNGIKYFGEDIEPELPNLPESGINRTTAKMSVSKINETIAKISVSVPKIDETTAKNIINKYPSMVSEITKQIKPETIKQSKKGKPSVTGRYKSIWEKPLFGTEGVLTQSSEGVLAQNSPEDICLPENDVPPNFRADLKEFSTTYVVEPLIEKESISLTINNNNNKQSE